MKSMESSSLNPGKKLTNFTRNTVTGFYDRIAQYRTVHISNNYYDKWASTKCVYYIDYFPSL